MNRWGGVGKFARVVRVYTVRVYRVAGLYTSVAWHWHQRSESSCFLCGEMKINFEMFANCSTMFRMSLYSSACSVSLLLPRQFWHCAEVPRSTQVPSFLLLLNHCCDFDFNFHPIHEEIAPNQRAGRFGILKNSTVCST